MLYAGLDLPRKRLAVQVLREDGTSVLVTAVSPDADALRTLAWRVSAEGQPVRRRSNRRMAPASSMTLSSSPAARS
jgi:hypothetical protein